ncbi:TIGR01906 family membrane protein [Streptococcus caprae]|uniref:TIGR01906 family membrane protein n=1 Tax=Streptococcus caprae TaxID=1640501 RepID=A0ABV8CVR0_9STRE
MKTKLSLISTVLTVLSLAILLTIYLAWLIYPWEVVSLGLTSWTGLDKATLLANFNHLMDYLTNPLSQVLNMPDFPSSASGLKHFADVKGLFHLTQTIFLITVIPTILFLKKSGQFKSLWIHSKTWWGLVVLPILIGGIGAVLGFETFFTVFHQLLFPGDSSWLFDPATDPVIMALPANFFLHCFLLFFVIYEILSLTLLCWSKAQQKQFKQGQKQSF